MLKSGSKVRLCVLLLSLGVNVVKLKLDIMLLPTHVGMWMHKFKFGQLVEQKIVWSSYKLQLYPSFQDLCVSNQQYCGS